MAFFTPLIDISAITLVLALASQFVQEKFMKKDEMKKHQAEMKARQQRMKELMQKADQKSKNELEALEKEMMEGMQKMMQGSSKVMIASLVIFLPAFAILGALYDKEIIGLPFPLPWLANGFDLFKTGTWGIEVYSQTNWFGWYFISYLAITIAMNFARDNYKKMVGKSG